SARVLECEGQSDYEQRARSSDAGEVVRDQMAATLSQIYYDVAVRLRAAYQKVAISRFLEWSGSVSDLPGNQTAFAVVTDTGPTGPTDRDVTRLGQFQNALIRRRVPVCRNAAARERDQGTCVGVVGRQPRRWCRGADNARGHRFAAVENLEMNTLRHEAEGRERLFHVGHEAVRSAEVDIGLSWQAERSQHRARQVTDRIIILAQLVAPVGPAITNVAAAAWESQHETSNFCREGVMLLVASRVQPQNLARRLRR